MRTTLRLVWAPWARWLFLGEAPSASRSLHELRRAMAVNGSMRDAGTFVSLRSALRPLLFRAGIALVINVVAGLGAALCLKALLGALLVHPSVGASTAGTGVVVFGVVAWVSLNHVFYLADALGVAARALVTEAMLASWLGEEGTQSANASEIDRESARIEGAWGGFVMIALSIATVLMVATFLFLALGAYALVVIAIVTACAFFVGARGGELTALYAAVSAKASRRAQIGTTIVRHRISFMANGWAERWLERYAAARRDEERSLQRVNTLLAVIGTSTAAAPVLALAVSAGMQAWLAGRVDVHGFLAAVAMVGTLRSVANGVPDALRTMAEGIVAHQRIDARLARSEAGSRALPVPDLVHPRHIAIVAADPSAARRWLRAAAACAPGRVHVSPAEPWVFTGTVAENILWPGHGAGDASPAMDALLRAVRLTPAILQGNDGVRYVSADGSGLSRGQKKRVDLARAVRAHADWVCLEDPSLALDDATNRDVLGGLLAGPLASTGVIFTVDAPGHAALADEFWEIDEQDRLTITCQGRAERRPAPASHPTKSLITDVQTADVVCDQDGGPAAAPAWGRIYRTALRSGLMATVVILSAVLVLRDIAMVRVDQLLAGLGRDASLLPGMRDAILLTFSALSLGLMASLATVRAVVTRAGGWCRALMTVALGGAQREPGYLDHLAASMTRDQRRVDEVLPALLMEVCGAQSLLLVTLGYAALGHPMVLPAYLGLFAVFAWSWSDARPALDAATRVDIRAGGRVLQAISDAEQMVGDGIAPGARASWMAWFMGRVDAHERASLTNFFLQRKYALRIDLLGMGAVASVVIAAVTGGVPAAGGSIASALGVSLTYGLVSIFGRVNRTAVQLEQVMHNIDRLVAVGAATETCRNASRDVEGGAMLELTGVSARAALIGPVLFRGMSLTLFAGEHLVVTGSSGSGKTTFVRLALGDLRPIEGEVITCGVRHPHSVSSLGKGQLQYYEAVSHVQGRSLCDHFRADGPAIMAAARALGVEALLARLPGGLSHEVAPDGKLPLSKGEAQQISLIEPVIHPPGLLVMDEATSFLSCDEEVAFLRRLRALLPDTAVLVVTHNAKLIDVFDRHLMIDGEHTRVQDRTTRADTAAPRAPRGMTCD